MTRTKSKKSPKKIQTQKAPTFHLLNAKYSVQFVENDTIIFVAKAHINLLSQLNNMRRICQNCETPIQTVIIDRLIHHGYGAGRFIMFSINNETYQFQLENLHALKRKEIKRRLSPAARDFLNHIHTSKTLDTNN